MEAELQGVKAEAKETNQRLGRVETQVKRTNRRLGSLEMRLTAVEVPAMAALEERVERSRRRLQDGRGVARPWKLHGPDGAA